MTSGQCARDEIVKRWAHEELTKVYPCPSWTYLLVLHPIFRICTSILPHAPCVVSLRRAELHREAYCVHE